ncbi:MAG: hypothetical protein WCJ30_05345 [Deltaproteobacteria bacterium]
MSGELLTPRLHTLDSIHNPIEPVSFVHGTNATDSHGIVGGQLDCHP